MTRVNLPELYPIQPGEAHAAWTDRLISHAREHGTYRQCSIGWHGECSQRHLGSEAECNCTCHAPDDTKDTRTMQILQIDSRYDGARARTKVTLDGDDRDGLHAFLEAANRHRTMLTNPGDGPALHFYTVTLYKQDETGPVWLQEIGILPSGGNTWVIESGPAHQGIAYRQSGPLGTAAMLDDV